MRFSDQKNPIILLRRKKTMSSSQLRRAWAPARPLQKRHRRFALHGNPTWPCGRHFKSVHWQMRNLHISEKIWKINFKKSNICHLTLLIASFKSFQSSGTKFTKVKAFPDWDPESPQPHQRFIRQCFFVFLTVSEMLPVVFRYLAAWPEIRRAPAVLDRNL